MLTKYAVRRLSHAVPESGSLWCECAVYNDAKTIAALLSAQYHATFAVITLGQGQHRPRLVAAFENGLQISTPARQEMATV